MLRAVDLLRQGRSQELWDMCCGYLRLPIDEFMAIQHRLMEDQIALLNQSALGRKLFRGAQVSSVADFRKIVPLTTYKDYCPELLERQEDTLPARPLIWAHTAGRSGEYSCKWIPLTETYAGELSKILFGIGILSGASDWDDTSHLPMDINILYTVAPSPYISGVFADVLKMQYPVNYMPGTDESQNMTFEERIKAGFKEAIFKGFDYFFGLSLILVNVSDKLAESSNKTSLRPFLKSPRALWRLAKGRLKSRLSGRPMLPRDLWKIRGIMGSGTDSFVYKDRIKQAWGRSPLDLYACTEGGVIATQTWDYDGMTFIPNLNFLEFIPEDEQLKNQLDSSYQPKTLLLDEVEAGESYEMVITGFHGNAVTRYRIGDMVRITSLRNEKLGIALPQMSFDRRVDDVIDLMLVRLTERTIWQAIERTGLPYEDWVACKTGSDATLDIFIELKDRYQGSEEEIAASIYRELMKEYENTRDQDVPEEYSEMTDFSLAVTRLPQGTFAGYTARRQAEGADVAHLKPRHVNPSRETVSLFAAYKQETTVVTKGGVNTENTPQNEAPVP